MGMLSDAGFELAISPPRKEVNLPQINTASKYPAPFAGTNPVDALDDMTKIHNKLKRFFSR
jgi:hypothetical protein